VAGEPAPARPSTPRTEAKAVVRGFEDPVRLYEVEWVG